MRLPNIKREQLLRTFDRILCLIAGTVPDGLSKSARGRCLLSSRVTMCCE